MSTKPEPKRTLEPLADRVIVRRIDAETTSAGGIIIPDNAKEKPQEGEVLAVGPGPMTEAGTRRALTVRPGDSVLFGKYAGTEVAIDGDDVLIMREDDILGVLRG